MDCTCYILSICVIVNILLIVLVAFQGTRYERDYTNDDSKYDFVLVSKHIHNLKENMKSVDFGVQGLSSEVEIIKTHGNINLINGLVTNFEFQSLSDLLEMEERLNEVNLKFEHLNTKFREVKDIVDQIKVDVEEIEIAFYMLELQSYMDVDLQKDNIEPELQVTLNYDSNDHNEDNQDPVPFDFGIFPNKKFTNEDSTRKFSSSDYEGSFTKEPISHNKTFKLSTEQVIWTDAMLKCFDEGLQLVTITSPAEQEEIVDVIKKADIGPADFWTSGSDLVRSGVFMWSTEKKLMTYFNWYPGEPSYGLFPVLNEPEHCVSLVHDFGYRWANTFCEKKKYFICESQESKNE